MANGGGNAKTVKVLWLMTIMVLINPHSRVANAGTIFISEIPSPSNIAGPLKVPALIITKTQRIKVNAQVENNVVTTYYDKQTKLDKPDIAIYVEDRIVLFKNDSLNLSDHYIDSSFTNINKKEFKPLTEAFPLDPTGSKKLLQIVTPYGIRLAPSALMFGAPISVAVVGSGIVTDVVSYKKGNAKFIELNNRINEQQQQINLLKEELNALKK